MENGSPATALASAAPSQQGSDPVAFGKHGELTYDELWAKEPGYCHWTIKKFKELVTEGVELDVPFVEGDSKMKRLAQWLIERERQAEENGPSYEYDKDGELVEVPTSLSLKERVDAAAAEKGPKFYGIAAPEKRVCTSWEECKKYVHGVKGVMYRSFATREEAEEYVQNPPARKTAAKKKSGDGGADGEAAPAKKKQKKVKDAASKVDADANPEAEDEVKTKAKASKAEAKMNAKVKAKGKATPKAKGKAKAKTNANVKSKMANAKGKDAAKEKLLAQVKAKARANILAKVKAKAKARGSTSVAVKAAVVAQPAGDEHQEKRRTQANNDVKDKVSKAVKTPATKSKTETPANCVEISAEVMQQAESLGYGASLRNLASRPEIMSSSLPGDKLLEALKACDGLVNKAKTSLLEVCVSTPSKAASSEKDATPKKEYKTPDAQTCKNEAKTTSSEMVVDEKSGLDMTEEQRLRIRENRERALAKKQRTLQEQSGGA